MEKNAYYFPHDSNARNDEKILFIRSKHGAEGYGIFWMLIETMHETSDGKLAISLLDGLAYSFNTDITLLKQIYNDCITAKLFLCDDEFYWSNRVLKNKSDMENKRSKKSQAGKKGMASRWAKDNKVITEDNTVITEHNKGKEIKEKKISSSEDSAIPGDVIFKYMRSVGRETQHPSIKEREAIKEFVSAGVTPGDVRTAYECMMDKPGSWNNLAFLKNEAFRERDLRLRPAKLAY